LSSRGQQRNAGWFSKGAGPFLLPEGSAGWQQERSTGMPMALHLARVALASCFAEGAGLRVMGRCDESQVYAQPSPRKQRRQGSWVYGWRGRPCEGSRRGAGVCWDLRVPPPGLRDSTGRGRGVDQELSEHSGEERTSAHCDGRWLYAEMESSHRRSTGIAPGTRWGAAGLRVSWQMAASTTEGGGSARNGPLRRVPGLRAARFRGAAAITSRGWREGAGMERPCVSTRGAGVERPCVSTEGATGPRGRAVSLDRSTGDSGGPASGRRTPLA
jgi:hypothetical protein